MSDKPKVDRSPKRGPDTRFPKGVSANPGGKSPRVGPNGETVTELARQHTAAAIDRVVAIMQASDDELALKAALALLDRGWGKPKESVDQHITAGSGVPIIQIVRASDVAQPD